jgi:hypothetical protein
MRNDREEQGGTNTHEERSLGRKLEETNAESHEWARARYAPDVRLVRVYVVTGYLEGENEEPSAPGKRAFSRWSRGSSAKSSAQARRYSVRKLENTCQ